MGSGAGGGGYNRLPACDSLTRALIGSSRNLLSWMLCAGNGSRAGTRPNRKRGGEGGGHTLPHSPLREERLREEGKGTCRSLMIQPFSYLELHRQDSMSLLPLQCLAVLSSVCTTATAAGPARRHRLFCPSAQRAFIQQLERMTEGMDDISAGPAPPPRSASPTSSTVDTGQVPEEKPEETVAAGESGEEGAEEGGGGGGGGDGDGEHLGALGIVALPGTCCVCIEMEQINHCLHSEKICILPILACLLSLALCTAGLKWVFVDKIFEYEPPTHLDPKRIGQDPIIISVSPTLGLT
ncbi:hypothetical protein FQN60_008503, partial [Etheostoma spectabile]